MRRLDREVAAVDVATPEPVVDEGIRDRADPTQLVRRHDARRAVRPRPVGGRALEEPRIGATVYTKLAAKRSEYRSRALESPHERRPGTGGERRLPPPPPQAPHGSPPLPR